MEIRIDTKAGKLVNTIYSWPDTSVESPALSISLYLGDTNAFTKRQVMRAIGRALKASAVFEDE